MAWEKFFVQDGEGWQGRAKRRDEIRKAIEQASDLREEPPGAISSSSSTAAAGKN